MKSRPRPVKRFLTVLLIVISTLCTPAVTMTNDSSSDKQGKEPEMKILFLHHSTGQNIWNGGVAEYFEQYNLENGTDYEIEEMIFPKRKPYGWNNYPYDYWNIWVRNSGPEPFMQEPTLEILTAQYDIIILKHCFPVSDILPDTGTPDISSDEKRLENYKLQYEALKKKMRGFPDTIFIVWTAAPRVKVTSLRSKISEFIKRRSVQTEYAERARKFSEWTVSKWDEPGDNIFVWDYFDLATGGGIFLKPEYAEAPGNSHPDKAFSERAARELFTRVIEVINGK